jgi:hypothetical protein
MRYCPCTLIGRPLSHLPTLPPRSPRRGVFVPEPVVHRFDQVALDGGDFVFDRRKPDDDFQCIVGRVAVEEHTGRRIGEDAGVRLNYDTNLGERGVEHSILANANARLASV